MTKRTVWFAALLAVVLSGSISPSVQAGEIIGAVSVGPYLNCQVVNPFPAPVTVTAIQYDYTCQSYGGAAFRFVPAVSCFGNCGLFPGFGNLFVGPSSYNCNVVFASCVALTVP